MKTLNRATKDKVSIKRNEDGSATIRGYGAVFYNPADPGTEYQMYGRVKERIMRGAFDSVFDREDDVRSMFNHDPNFLLGRTKAGSLEIGVDDRGLWYRTTLPATQAGKDVAELIERGDVDGSSFWFGMAPGDYNERTEGDDEIVDIVNVSSLRELGPVVFPAYESTTAHMRTADISKDREPPKKEETPKNQKDADEAAAFVASL